MKIMLSQVLLDAIPTVINESSNVINYIVGGAAVAGTSSAVTIAVIQAKLKRVIHDVDEVTSDLKFHKREHINFDAQTITHQNDMKWIKEAIGEIKSEIKSKN